MNGSDVVLSWVLQNYRMSEIVENLICSANVIKKNI